MAVSIALKIKICSQMFHIGSMNLCPKYGTVFIVSELLYINLHVHV